MDRAVPLVKILLYRIFSSFFSSLFKNTLQLKNAVDVKPIFPCFEGNFQCPEVPSFLLQVSLFSNLGRKKKFLSSFFNLSRLFLSAFF